MALSLDSIRKGKQKQPVKILLYGTDKIGKSTFASQFASAIFSVTEDRVGHIDVHKFPVATSYDALIENVNFLISEDHPYKTYVIDSIDWAEKLIHKHLCNEHKEESIIANSKGSPFAFGRGAVLAEALMRKFLLKLDELRSTKKMNIVLIAHAEIKTFEDPMRDNYDKYWPNLDKRARDTIMQWADCVLFANWEIFTKSDKGGFGADETKGIGHGRRLLYTEERPSFKAGNSFDLPAEMEFDFNIFINHLKEFYGDNKKEEAEPAGRDTKKRKSVKQESGEVRESGKTSQVDD